MARPRKSGPRTKSGRLSRGYKGPARDVGTAESRAKKAWLVNGADPDLAATASGILLARGYLNRDQYAAALRYAKLHAAIFGAPHRQLCILGRDGRGGRPLEDAEIERRRQELDAMHARLTPDQRKAVADVACFGMIPQWFYAERLDLRVLPEDHRDRDALVSGLEALAHGAGTRDAA